MRHGEIATEILYLNLNHGRYSCGCHVDVTNIMNMVVVVMNRLQTSGELQDKTSFIDPSTGVDLLKGCSPHYLLL
jgi:hypothetical protein